MKRPRLVAIAVTSLSLLCPAGLFATTLTYSLVSQELAALTATSVSDSSTCIQTTAANQFPLQCERDSLGGHVQTNIGGTFPPGGTFSQPVTFTGKAAVAIFNQPGADTVAAVGGYTFQMIIGPQVAGDTFSFTLKQVNTCVNSLGPCVTTEVSVAGATSIKGKLATGQKIVANKPVVIFLTQTISVDNVVPVWSQNISATIEITPGNEAPAAAWLTDQAEDTPSSDGDGQK